MVHVLKAHDIMSKLEKDLLFVQVDQSVLQVLGEYVN